MKHLALVSCLLIAFASLGCGGTSDDTNGDVDGGTGGADGGTGGTDGGIDGGTGGTDGGTGGTDGGTGGTNGGTGGTVGGDQCDYVGENTGAGWSGPPSCSATEILQGDPLTCTVQAVGGIDVGAIIVDRETLFTAGGGFTDISSDGPAEIVLDTQFAEPGEYVIIFDASDGSNFITFTFGDDSQNNNYFTFEELGGSITDIVELPGCVLITITVLPE